MATHSSILAWRIPLTEEPGRLQSIGWQRVRSKTEATSHSKNEEVNKQNLVLTRTQEKGAVTPQEADPDLPVSVQKSLVEAWVGGGCCRVGALSAAVRAWGLLKEAPLSSLPPP